MDLRAAEERQPKFDDNLRRLVDCLPRIQRHLINRVVFAGETMNTASAEASISRYKAEREHREAIRTLRGWLDDPDTAPTHEGWPSKITPVKVGRNVKCAERTEWGRCQQIADPPPLCPFHEEVKAKHATPDREYHRQVVLGLKEPQQSRFTETELRAFTQARYRGDGRRLDAYAYGADPLEIDL